MLLAALNLLQWLAGRSEDEAIGRFVSIWSRQVGIYKASRWLGIETLQNPTDAWVTQEILQEVKPDFVVEAGTYKGGSALYWAQVLEQVNPEGRVITIDVEDRTSDAARQPLWQRRVDFLLGSSTDPAIAAEVSRRVAGGKVLVILDSLHTHDHVKAELEAYAPLVSEGSYLVVQDTGVWRPAPSPERAARAVAEFLEANDAFVADRARERFLITNNPSGYLKRIRPQ